jgi:hypothetical protein
MNAEDARGGRCGYRRSSLPRIANFLLREGDAGAVKYHDARDTRRALSLATVAAGFALLAADLASAPGLGHATLLSRK